MIVTWRSAGWVSEGMPLVMRRPVDPDGLIPREDRHGQAETAGGLRERSE